jgi:hypothetical protein
MHLYIALILVSSGIVETAKKCFTQHLRSLMCEMKSFTLIIAGLITYSAAKSSKKATISGREMKRGMCKSYSFSNVELAPIQLMSLIIVGLRYSNMY